VSNRNAAWQSYHAAFGRFLEAVDRDRWWSTPELTVALVASGLWQELDLGDPNTQHIKAYNGPRHYGVTVDDGDWTSIVDWMLTTVCKADHNPSGLVRTAVVSPVGWAMCLYKRFEYLKPGEVEAINTRMKLEQEFLNQLRTDHHLVRAARGSRQVHDDV
jgi:hypothetical protein